MKKGIRQLEQEQAENQETSMIFHQFMRDIGRRALITVMEQEVDLLCGEAYHPMTEASYRRAGSEKGRVYFENQAHAIVRPRVRHRNSDGEEKETPLKSYRIARDRNRLSQDVVEMLEGGMSLRGIRRMKRNGFSASTAQKIWVEESAKSVIRLRERDLRGEKFLGLMIDGVVLSREMVVVVAIGICTDGRKKVLDFVVGNTENYALCQELLKRLVKRGFQSATVHLIVVIDGADALEKAVLEFFPDAEIQRCWVHKERNLHAYLNKKDHGECSNLIDRVRKAQGEIDGRACYDALHGFLQERNAGAVKSLEEAGERLLTFHRLNVPSTLNTTFLSTNMIENVMLNFRRRTGRVTRWYPESDQANRWTASALLMAEEGFQKIRHSEDLPALVTALGGTRPAVASGSVPDSTLRVAVASPPTSSTPPEAKGKTKKD